MEYSFVAGDRVDVMFENHLPEQTAVEIEVEDDNNLCIGIHQTVKYKSLMEHGSCYSKNPLDFHYWKSTSVNVDLVLGGGNKIDV